MASYLTTPQNKNGFQASQVWQIILVAMLVFSWVISTPVRANAVSIPETLSKTSKAPVTPLGGPDTISFQTSVYTVSEGVGTAIVTATRAVGTNNQALSANVLVTDVTTTAADYVAPNLAGSLDATFLAAPAAGANNIVTSIDTQIGGKILISGIFTTYNGVARGHIARLNADGNLDATFLATGAGANGTIQSFAVQTDGKIVIGGNFTTYNGFTRTNIARLNVDGSLDATFVVGTGTNLDIAKVSLQADGKIVIGGNFTSYNGVVRNRLARLNVDGSLDATFLAVPAAGANLTVRDIIIQTGGKILIAGDFTSYNATLRGRVARLNADGSLDATFLATGVGANATVNAIRVQSDGRVIIAGAFATYNGVARSGIARLNSDGSLDTSFTSTPGASSFVFAVALQTNGQIVIVGQFTLYNGVARSGIARLNFDGSLETGFNPGTGATGGIVDAIAIQADNKIVIGGGFTAYNGVARGRIVRINEGLTVSWAANEFGPKTIRIVIVDDGLVEPTESFRLGLALSISGTSVVTPAQTTVNIVDNDVVTAASTLSINSSSVITEGNAGVILLNFVVTRTGSLTQTSSVAYTTADGTATIADNDYVASSGTLVFGVGVVSRTITTTIVGDLRFEANETFQVNLSNPVNAAIAVTQGIGTIINNDAPPTFSISPNISVTEGNTLTTNAVFTVTLTPVSGITATVSYSTTDITAQLADLDYINAAGALVFPPGVTSRVITVAVRGDTRFENNETFRVGLGTPTNAVFGISNSSVGTIINDDNLPNLIIANANVTEGNTGTTSLLFTVTLSSSSGVTASVNYATSDSTATVADNDYISSSGTLVFAPGVVSRVVTVTVIGDTRFEPNENLMVTLSNQVSATIADGSAIGTIVNDDGFVCDPLVVSSTTDDGDGTVCGTLSNAINVANAGALKTITFQAGLSAITMTALYLPAITSGVVISGGNNCASPVTINGNEVVGGLVLEGNVTLQALYVHGFDGSQIYAQTTSGANRLICIRTSRN